MRFGGWGPTEQVGLRVERRQWGRGEGQKIKGHLSPPPTPQGRPGLRRTPSLGLVGTGVYSLPLLRKQLGRGLSLALCEGRRGGRGLAASPTSNPDPEPWD